MNCKNCGAPILLTAERCRYCNAPGLLVVEIPDAISAIVNDPEKIADNARRLRDRVARGRGSVGFG